MTKPSERVLVSSGSIIRLLLMGLLGVVVGRTRLDVFIDVVGGEKSFAVVFTLVFVFVLLFLLADLESELILGRVEVFDSCLFLKLLNSSVSLLELSLLAGMEELIFSFLKNLQSGGGVFEFAFCSSAITACRIENMDAAG